MGGAVTAIERGFVQREITDSAYRDQKEVEAKRRVVVGVNDFKTEEQTPIRTLQIDPRNEERLTKRLEQVKSNRNRIRLTEALDRLRRAAEDEKANLMPFVLTVVKEYGTLGELCGTFREIFGEYEPSCIF
jgi:methylmalonyl-CoA mutase N-terminal domain/subunit